MKEQLKYFWQVMNQRVLKPLSQKIQEKFAHLGEDLQTHIPISWEGFDNRREKLLKTFQGFQIGKIQVWLKTGFTWLKKHMSLKTLEWIEIGLVVFFLVAGVIALIRKIPKEWYGLLILLVIAIYFLIPILRKKWVDWNPRAKWNCFKEKLLLWLTRMLVSFLVTLIIVALLAAQKWLFFSFEAVVIFICVIFVGVYMLLGFRAKVKLVQVHNQDELNIKSYTANQVYVLTCGNCGRIMEMKVENRTDDKEYECPQCHTIHRIHIEAPLEPLPKKEKE